MPPTGLIPLLRNPHGVANITDAQWNDVVEQGRRTQLLGQLAARLRQAGVFEQVLPAVQRHLALAELTSRRRGEAATWEVKGMRRAINPATTVVLLKGCAYAAAGDANAPGRLFSDVDLMVRRQDLEAVESSLISVGWKPSRVNDYDQAYYRNWMHEVPPMEHVRRHTVVDLHHAINPPVSRFYVNPDKLFDHLVEVLPGVFVLSPTDRVIHCALHLLQEGESKKLIRDLFDLYLLVQQHHSTDQGYVQLRQRARALGVVQLVDAALGAALGFFDNPHPPIGGQHASWLQHCVSRAALGSVGRSSVANDLASTAVLAHSHWMKMPLRLLLPHLAHKTWIGWFPEKE
jgi:hypothetical protein